MHDLSAFTTTKISVFKVTCDHRTKFRR